MGVQSQIACACDPDEIRSAPVRGMAPSRDRVNSFSGQGIPDVHVA